MLILSPHLDDAVLSAWCDLPGATVANLCTAVPPAGVVGDFDRTKGAADGAAFMSARLAEDAAALALAGVESRLELGFLDAQYRDGPLDPDAIREALPQADRTGAPVTLYADLPYAARVGWPAWVTGEAPRDHWIPEARWELFLADLPGRLEPRAIALDARQRAAKERALRTYATQFEVLNGGPVNRLLNPAVLGFEVRWDVSPA